MQQWNRLADKFELNSLSKLSEIEKSDYLQGKVNSWKITFDWLIINENNILKVVEGNYRNSKLKESSKTNLNSVPTEYEISEKC